MRALDEARRLPGSEPQIPDSDDPAATEVDFDGLRLPGPVSDPGALAAGEALFRRHGLCWIPECLPSAQVEGYRGAAEERLAGCLQRITDLGHPPLGRGTPNGFAEIVARAPGRYDMLHGTASPPFDGPEVRDNPQWMPLVRRLLGGEASLLFCGLLMTMGGAKEQPWHTDGEHLFGPEVGILPPHCLNVFIPLVDITPEIGGTEFCPGSHFLTAGIPEIYEQSQDHVRRIGWHGRRLPATIPAGAVLLFDYRLLHRGLANQTDRTRPILYLTFCRPWFRDVHNFPERRLFEGG
ncbi:MAG: phytanoyl-CoA dioxygenase family protein [Myxococcales bacterium]|nr:phytanoyl-CoA dioxygenase family protein [Myxococcales bacterium]MCB9569492.1 phytanoyl-CoA dioxygenase family protein [Myxococcales bacterium]MCB9706173.1 phytanoyl-CoA dioxygenase family protein [Myxococcales bacterium]